MRSFRAIPTTRSYTTRIHPALTSLADEVCGTLAHLIAYVGALALLAILGFHLLDQLPVGEAIERSARAGWSVATRSYPAFAVSQIDLPEKTETYEILRHPLGGNDPKLPELFARTELKRGSCAPSAASATSTDWVMGAENLHLRGTL
jgi:hypothetical protein